MTIDDVGTLFSDYILHYIGSEEFEKVIKGFDVDKNSVIHDMCLSAMLFCTNFKNEYLTLDSTKSKLDKLQKEGRLYD